MTTCYSPVSLNLFLLPCFLTLSLCQEGTEPLPCGPGRFQASMEAELLCHLLHEALYFPKSSKHCPLALELSDPNTHEAAYPPQGCELHQVQNLIFHVSTTWHYPACPLIAH